MISREEAKEDFELQEISSGYVNSNFLDRIYDSIGSCSECKHSEEVEVSVNGILMQNEIACTRGSFDPIEPDFFCADFERKDNVEA